MWTGILIISPEDVKMSYVLRFSFNATNNDAEYKALYVKLKIA